MQGDNPNLLGFKHVADVIRTLQVGVSGRITTRLESELDETSLISETNAFFDLLCEAFPDLEGVRNGSMSPVELRKHSLLGSVTMLRVLAGVHQEIASTTSSDEDTHAQVLELFSHLSKYMDTPIKSPSHWLESKAFREGSNAPTARMGDMGDLRTHMVSWLANKPTWLFES